MATAVISEIQMGYKPNLISSKIIRIIFGILETVFLKKRILSLWCCTLNRASKVIVSYQLSKGGITGTIADVRLRLHVVLKTLATGLISAHNHPSRKLHHFNQAITIQNRNTAGNIHIQTKSNIFFNPQLL